MSNEMPNLSGFTDESKYQGMLKNRPNPNIFPSPNRRILGQRIGHSAFINIALIGIFFGVFFTQTK